MVWKWPVIPSFCPIFLLSWMQLPVEYACREKKQACFMFLHLMQRPFKGLSEGLLRSLAWPEIYRCPDTTWLLVKYMYSHHTLQENWWVHKSVQQHLSCCHLVCYKKKNISIEKMRSKQRSVFNWHSQVSILAWSD